MALKHDAQGFLVGELIKTNDDILSSQEQSVRVLSRIRTDVSAIARALNVQVKAAARAARTPASRARPLAPAVVARGRSSGATVGGNQTAGPAQRSRAAAAGGQRPATSTVAVTSSRDSKGRFTKGAEVPDGAKSPSEASSSSGIMTRLSDNLGRLSGTLNAADNVDPTVNAFKEVADVVTPLGRGLFSMFGKGAERKKERWYQRILKALTNPVMGKRQTVAIGGSGSPGMLSAMMGGMFGGVGGLLSKVPSMLMFMLKRIFLPIAAVWGSFELGRWIGGKIYSWLDESGWNTKLFDAIDTIKTVFTDTWKSVTDGFDNAIKMFKSIPDRLGNWLSSLDETMRNLPVIGKVYAKATDTAKAIGAEAKTGYEEGRAGKNGDPATTAAQAIARDVGATVKATKDVGAQAGAGYDDGRGAKSDAPAPTNIAQRAARAVGGSVGAAANAATLAREAIAQGIADPGKLALFMGQMHHESGGFKSTRESLNYSPEQLLKTFKGRNGINSIDDARRIVGGGQDAIAEAIYGGAWGAKNLGNTQAGDGARFHGRGFTQLTGRSNYVAAGKALGLDLVNQPELAEDPAVAAKVAGWFWRTRVANKGADGSLAASTKAINGGMKGFDDRAAQTAKYEGLISRGGIAAVAAGMATASTGFPVVRAANVPSAMPAQIPEQAKAEVPERLNTAAGAGGKLTVSLKDKTSQNVPDARLAHVVSGGIGAS